MCCHQPGGVRRASHPPPADFHQSMSSGVAPDSTVHTLCRAALVSGRQNDLTMSTRGDFGFEASNYRLVGLRPPSDERKQALFAIYAEILGSHPGGVAGGCALLHDAVQDPHALRELTGEPWIVTSTDLARGIEPPEKTGAYAKLKREVEHVISEAGPKVAKSFMVTEVERRHLGAGGDLLASKIILCQDDQFTAEYVRML